MQNQRTNAFWLGIGACVLIFRTAHMLYFGALYYLVLWVASLLLLEMAIDVGCLIACILWWLSSSPEKATIPLRMGATAAILHATRVLIFALGRTDPFLNFDVRPEHHSSHSERWSWFWVYFACTLSVLGLVGVVVIWNFRRKAKSKKE